MTEATYLVYFLIYSILALLMIFYTVRIMSKKKCICSFLPFIFAGGVFILDAAFAFFGLFEFSIWFVKEFLYIIALIWVFVVIARHKEWI